MSRPTVGNRKGSDDIDEEIGEGAPIKNQEAATEG